MISASSASRATRRPSLHRLVKLAVILSSVVVAACIPVSATFYKPAAVLNGVITNYGCDGAGGQPNSLAINRGNVKLVASVVTYPAPPVTAVITVWVPRTVTVDFDTMHIGVTDSSGNVVGHYLRTTVEDWQQSGAKAVKSLPPPANTLLGSRYTSNRYPSAVYEVWLALRKTLPDVLYVRIPKMAINGRAYAAFSIRFHKTRETYLQPFNGC